MATKKVDIHAPKANAKWTNSDKILLVVKELLEEYADTISKEIDGIKETVERIPVIKKNGVETRVSMTLQEAIQNVFNELYAIRSETLPKMQQQINDLYDPFKGAERFNQRSKVIIEFVKYAIIFLLALGVIALYGKLIGI